MRPTRRVRPAGSSPQPRADHRQAEIRLYPKGKHVSTERNDAEGRDDEMVREIGQEKISEFEQTEVAEHLRELADRAAKDDSDPA